MEFSLLKDQYLFLGLIIEFFIVIVMENHFIMKLVQEIEMQRESKNAKVILKYAFLRKEHLIDLKLSKQVINLFDYFLIMFKFYRVME
jgi:hypothetical protein